MRRHDGNWLVSVFLVNAQARPSALPDSAWLFQVVLTLTGPGRAPVFLPRPDGISGGGAADKAEQKRLAMAYRSCPEFAVGHGVGVHAIAAGGDPMRAVEITTAAVPAQEIPFTDVPEPGKDPGLTALDGVVLDMKVLADLDLPSLVAGLTPLVSAYRDWIGRQQARIADPGCHLAGYAREAGEALSAARHAGDRIEAGIATLQADDAALAAFRFANEAMYLQRVHTLAAEAERIYARRGDQPMAGIMLYTAAPDSEGTLGGLVSLGRRDRLGGLIDRALDSARLCTSDPLCADHDPRDRGELSGAACHACLFASETSCEHGNYYLDRALLVDTITGGGTGFLSR